ncbi:hypothetical protein ABTY61_36540 [Kitasatospora sp. NPDC096128]|uniref:hypothetical protein n=1 Tax=Kitasatospora sp. NPDC096128 TaxID=3155547 RepID=UPI003334212C
MADYDTHAARAEAMLADLGNRWGATTEIRVQMAQIEAILALAAAVAGRTAPPPPRTAPPQAPPPPPAQAPFPPPIDRQRRGR